jgi:hypothetical protein
VARVVVCAAAPVGKSGWLRTPALRVSATMNATVAVRKRSPMRAAVFLVDAVVGPLGSVVGSVTVGMGSLSGADMVFDL